MILRRPVGETPRVDVDRDLPRLPGRQRHALEADELLHRHRRGRVRRRTDVICGTSTPSRVPVFVEREGDVVAVGSLGGRSGPSRRRSCTTARGRTGTAARVSAGRTSGSRRRCPPSRRPCRSRRDSAQAGAVGASSARRGNVTGRRPPGAASPRRMAAVASAPSCPGTTSGGCRPPCPPTASEWARRCSARRRYAGWRRQPPRSARPGGQAATGKRDRVPPSLRRTRRPPPARAAFARRDRLVNPGPLDIGRHP